MPELKRATLPNGLRVVAEVDPRGYSMAMGYFVRAGSRDELDPQSGLSHFLEHMMFKGTDRRSAGDVNRELDELGGQGNAYTTEEHTAYYAPVLPKFQDRLVDLLTDLMTPVLDEDEFNTEKDVILSEIAKYDDQPPFGGFERAMEVYFSPRGLGRRVLGTTESIQAMTADRMRDYFRARYRPENIVLAATGNVDFDGLVAEAEKRTAVWSERKPEEAIGPDDPKTLPDGIELSTRVETPDTMQAYAIQIGPGPASGSKERHAARLLATILGDEGGSRLFWELIDTGRAEVATCWPQEFSDCGAWFNYLVCAPEDLDANRRSVKAIISTLIKDGVEKDELDRAINKTCAGYIMQSEQPINRLFTVGSRCLMHDQYIDLDESLSNVREVDAAAVVAAAQKYFAEPHTEILASAG